MKCKNCGYDLREGTRICTKCGTVQRKYISKRILRRKKHRNILVCVFLGMGICAGAIIAGMKWSDSRSDVSELVLEETETEIVESSETIESVIETEAETIVEITEAETSEPETVASPPEEKGMKDGTEIGLSSDWKYADFSKINRGKAIFRRSEAENRKGVTVCVNAGHGTEGGSSVKTLCHPDGTPKVTGGTTSAGATEAIAVSGGMTFADGTPEHKVTLEMALIFRDKLLAEGYDVLMIRESKDVQLDNVARTVIANNKADCHIALHWDSTESNKGAFYMSVPSNSNYRSMEPVASHWEEHNRLGEALIEGLRKADAKIFSGGSMEMDLTQTSYSTVPSIDIELGDKVSDHSESGLRKLAEGLVAGVNIYFGK